MEELYDLMGFSENPFSNYSAEEEFAYLDKIYIIPRYYNTIFNDIKNGSSRFVFGERGIGKSALMHKLQFDLKAEKVFPIVIDDYSGIKPDNNQKELLNLIIEKAVTQLGVILINNKKVLMELKKADKEKLTFFINNFFKTISQDEFNRLYDMTTGIKIRKGLAKVFNILFRKPINIALSGISELFATTVSKSLGLSQVSEDFYKNYLPELVVNGEVKKTDLESLSYSSVKSIFKVLVELILKCNYKNIVVFCDKIDEYQDLGTNITKIAEFIKAIATDTSLLQLNHCSFVLIIWSRVKDTLNSIGGRYDKFKPINITWTEDELRKIIDERLKHFSNRKVTIESILPDSEYVNKILKLAYKSPRHLIMLLSKIYDEQITVNTNVNKFSEEAIAKGILNYAKTFDFPSLYPGEKGKKSYIVNVVNRMIKVGKVEFQSTDLVNTFKFSTQSANNDIKIMKDYGLIIEVDNVGNISKRYQIVEPRIEYLIHEGVLRIDLPE